MPLISVALHFSIHMVARLYESTLIQIDVDITVTGTNDFSPVFDSSVYRSSLQEFDSFTGTSPINPGSTVIIVHATDRDGLGSPAGQLEYRVTTGAVQLGVEMFSIPDPSVSSLFQSVQIISD